LPKSNRDEVQVKHDAWLTGLMGYDSYHLSGIFQDFQSNLTFEKKSFIDVKIPVDQIEPLMVLQNLGFRIIDTNVQLLKTAGEMRLGGYKCRFASEHDYDSVCEIAGSSFTKSRFHLDPLISKETADLVKKEWAGNFFKGLRGKWMVLAEVKGKVVGFLQLLKRSDSAIVIDLIAIEPNMQGRGIAGSMISFANSECLETPGEIIVGTQISNIQSLAFYVKHGFRIISADYVLHLHTN
jgi:ribosomal protein S18 acetylase RimI-like enzyme